MICNHYTSPARSPKRFSKKISSSALLQASVVTLLIPSCLVPHITPMRSRDQRLICLLIVPGLPIYVNAASTACQVNFNLVVHSSIRAAHPTIRDGSGKLSSVLPLAGFDLRKNDCFLQLTYPTHRKGLHLRRRFRKYPPLLHLLHHHWDLQHQRFTWGFGFYLLV